MASWKEVGKKILKHLATNNSKSLPKLAQEQQKVVVQQRLSPSPTERQVPAPAKDVEEIFNKMKATGLVPNVVNMLQGLAKDGLAREALNLFVLMRQRGSLPDVVVYTASVEAFLQAREPDRAMRVFKEMQEKGITPNAFSYGVLIRGLCEFERRHLDDAVGVCLEMLGEGHSPNVSTFVGLVDGVCRCKGVDEARRVVAALREKGFLINNRAVTRFLRENLPNSSCTVQAIFGKREPK